MKILIYGINFYPELVGVGKYTGEMARHLAKQGYSVSVITAPPYYPTWKIDHQFSDKKTPVSETDDIKVIRCPLYVPKNPTKLTRLLHLLSFAISSFPALLIELIKRPDVVFAIQPTFMCTPTVVLLGKLLRLKIWLHIQDFEIDAMLHMDGEPRQSRLFSMAMKFEQSVMKRFDRVSTISQGLRNVAISKGVAEEKLLQFPNWVDTAYLTPNPHDDFYRDKWGFKPEDKIVLYSGNIGRKQNWDALVHAAKSLEKDPQVKFLVIGDGAYKARLAERCDGLSNLAFHPLQPYEDLPHLLNMADIHLVMQARGFGDVVMPSKLGGIFSCGGYSIITTDEDSQLGLLCKNYPGIARLVVSDCQEHFVHALREELSQIDKRPPFNEVARNYALEYLQTGNVLAQFDEDLLSLVDSKAALATE